MPSLTVCTLARGGRAPGRNCLGVTLFGAGWFRALMSRALMRELAYGADRMVSLAPLGRVAKAKAELTRSDGIGRVGPLNLS